MSAIISEKILEFPIISQDQITENSPIVVEYNLKPNQVYFPPIAAHGITINLGEGGNLFREQDGRTEKALMLAGSMTLTPAGEARQWHWDHRANALNIILPSQLLWRVAENLELNLNCLEFVNKFGILDPQIEQLGGSILQEIKSPGLGEALYIESLTNLLAIHLLRHYSAFPAKMPPVRGKLGVSRMQQVIDYMSDRLPEKIALADLAAVANLSPYHFSRLFREETGLTPHQYLIRCRVEKAKRLLATGKVAIAEVAHQVGFADQSHLTRHFKRIIGATPRQFQTSYVGKTKSLLWQ